MKFTGSKYSHVSVAVNVQGDIYIVEMQRTGCDLISLNNWKKKYDYHYEVFRPLKPMTVKRILSKASSTKYDVRSLFMRQPIKIIKEKLFGKNLKLKKLKNENDRMTCSEYVAWVYFFQNYYDLTPEDVINECIKKNFLKVNLN